MFGRPPINDPELFQQQRMRNRNDEVSQRVEEREARRAVGKDWTARHRVLARQA
jgi:hypothetical protein